jgi:hypothetical protein
LDAAARVLGAAVLRMEQDVLQFIDDASRDILEFPADYTNYQV